MTAIGKRPWWEPGTIYQVYPRSFQDSDGDGVGDLEGVRRRLPYIASLGVDAVWLSPIFVSPMADFGYDVADYIAIDPLFGTMADFDRLIADAHAAGLRLILDFVPNHSSDKHRWFVASRASRASSKRDWYIWRDPAADGGPPNNWTSYFGGSAWEWDAASGQYYLHSFLKEQPDLNWRNPELRAAMLDVLRFWLDRGVDGFRVDVVWLILKDAALRDNPPNPDWREGMQDILRTLPVHSGDQPEVHQAIAAMRALLDSYGDRLLIGEIYLPNDRLVAYYGADGGGAQLPFNFQLFQAEWRAPAIAGIVAAYEAALPAGGWPNWVLGNHDQPRVAARIGAAQARVAMLLLLTLRGTPTLYYGDEIGMTGAPIPPDRVRDPQALREPGIGFNRDEARTPMRWDDTPGAGFTTGAAWLPIDPHGASVADADDPASMLALTRALLALRRAEPALALGDYRELVRDDAVFGYERTLGDARFAVFANLTDRSQTIATPAAYAHATIRLSTAHTRSGTFGSAPILMPNEALIVEA